MAHFRFVPSLESRLSHKPSCQFLPTLSWAKEYIHPDLVNLYGCAIGDETQSGGGGQVQKNALIGKRCQILRTLLSAKG